MCFSAAASFSGAAILGVTGLLCLKKTTSSRQLFLACIPFLFAIQQFVEGMMWMASYGDLAGFIQTFDVGKYIFLTIALGIWPLWIPLSMYAIETVGWRKTILFSFLIFGIIYCVMAFIHLFYLWQPNDIIATIDSQSIRYGLPLDSSKTTIYTFFYLIATLIPPFFSSYRWMGLLGIANALTFVIATYLYFNLFISVWCFFAAWMSIGILIILSTNRDKLETTTE